MTIVVPEARWGLLRALDQYEQYREQRELEAQAGVVDIRLRRAFPPGHMPTHVPLFSAEHDVWDYDDETVLLAARECSKMGWIELNEWTAAGPMVRITPKGSESLKRAER